MKVISTIHEMGHALYEQGIGREFEATLSWWTSSGVHESQSRLWKTWWGVARFWKFFYPQLQAVFPTQR